MYLCKEICDYPFTYIGRSFNKDHTTVIHSYKKIQETIATNPNVLEAINSIKKNLLSLLPIILFLIISIFFSFNIANALNLSDLPASFFDTNSISKIENIDAREIILDANYDTIYINNIFLKKDVFLRIENYAIKEKNTIIYNYSSDSATIEWLNNLKYSIITRSADKIKITNFYNDFLQKSNLMLDEYISPFNHINEDIRIETLPIVIENQKENELFVFSLKTIILSNSTIIFKKIWADRNRYIQKYEERVYKYKNNNYLDLQLEYIKQNIYEY